MEKHKTIIIGAGPGGLRCAKILADNKEDFILVERKTKFDRKICTGMWGISEKTNYMKLPDKLFEKKFRKVVVSTPHRKIELKCDKPFVATLNRKELSEYMYREAKKSGAEIMFDSPVSEIGIDYVIVKGKKIYFNNLIGADGSSSIVRKSLGLNQHIGIGIQYWVKKEFKNMEIHFDADKFGPWFAWIAPHNGLTSIGTGSDPRLIPSNKLRENLNSWCLENDISISSAKFEGAPINYDYQGYKFNNKYLIGDAAGFASGLTGEGIYFAMASGEDVANMIINKNYEPLLIDKILAIKRKHEIIANTFKLNKTLEKIEYDLLLNLLKIKLFDKKAIDLVA